MAHCLQRLSFWNAYYQFPGPGRTFWYDAALYTIIQWLFDDVSQVNLSSKLEKNWIAFCYLDLYIQVPVSVNKNSFHSLA